MNKIKKIIYAAVIFIIVSVMQLNNVNATEMVNSKEVDISVETDKENYSREDINAKFTIKNNGKDDININHIEYSEFADYKGQLQYDECEIIEAGQEKSYELKYVYNGSRVSPQTGDSHHIIIWLVIITVVILMAIYFTIDKKKRNKFISLLISILLFLSALFGLFIDNVHAEVINNKISSISKEITVDGLKENLDIEISYNTISNSDYITKGEFIHNLLDHLDVERLELNDSTYEFLFSDTYNSTYGLDAEYAWSYGLLPDDEKIFKENEYISREYAAYIVYHIMGFEGDYIIDYNDSELVNYRNEVALVAAQEFIPLINGAFLPDKYISSSDYQTIVKRIDWFNDALNEVTDEANISYKSEVIEIATDNYSISEENDEKCVIIDKDNQTNNLKMGDLFVLSAKDGYSYVLAGKVLDSYEYNGKIKLVYCEPEYEEIVQDIKISKEIQIDTDSLVLEEGVSLDCDNDEESDISLLKIQTPNKPGKLSLKIGTEYVNAKIEADIPTYIVNWNINEASMIMNYSGQVSGNIEYNTKLDNSNEKYDKMYKLGKVWSIPINGLFKVEVDLYLYVSISGKTSVVWSYSGSSGVQYKNGTFRIIKQFRLDNLKQPVSQGNANAKMGPSIVSKLKTTIGNENLIQMNANVGGTMNLKKEIHRDINPALECGDFSLYAYLEFGIDKECRLAKLLKFGGGFLNINLNLNWVVYNENNSPLKWKLHIENNKVVPACTYGYGTIYGKVVDDWNNPVCNAVVNVVNVDTGEVVLNGVTSTSNTGEIKKGDFLFKNVRIGNYKVEISTNDYEIVSKYISVFKNKTSDCGIIKLNRVKYDDYDIVKLNGHYDVVKMISEGKYLVVKDGLCGVIDANENLIIPIIYNADNSKEVAVDEILLVKDNVGYVYNSNTLNLICRYLIEETIEDSSAYKYEKITESSEYVNYPDNIIKREYWQGMIIETVECGWSMSSNGSSGVWNSVYVKFINARTGKNIVQGFGKSYIPISGDNWNGIATSSKTNDHSAVAVIEDIENDKLFMYIITKDGCNGREISSNEVVGENVAYDNHWIKMRGYIPEQGYAWKLMNVDTGHTYSMPYNEFSSWYYGNDKYYALSLEGSLYNICYENRIISTQKYKFVNFTNDKILIAGDLNGECIFMDYSLNEKLRAKDASVYWNGKALVYDGIGVYYIDEFCKKTSSYLYKNTSIDYMSIGAFKAEGQWYIIK